MSDLAKTCSLTHHTFLIGPWDGAGKGAVKVTQLDDEDAVVLILRPSDVMPFIAALVAANAGTSIAIDNHELVAGRVPSPNPTTGDPDAH